jgi:hypothetical protein
MGPVGSRGVGRASSARRALGRGLVAIVVAGLVAGGCSGDDDDGSERDGADALSQDGLAAAGDTCPVDLPGAVAAAGLEADGDLTVEVTEGTGDAGVDGAAIDQVGGVHVACSQPLGLGEVEAVVFASDRPGAVGLLLPQIQGDLGVAADDIEDLFRRTEGTDVGELVDLGVAGPAALARLDVDGAESGVLYVFSSSASPDEVRAVAEHLLGA